MPKKNFFTFLLSKACRLTLILVVLFLLGATNASFGATSCELAKPERDWLNTTINSWQTVSRKSLRLKEVPLTWMIWFDKSCVWHINPDTSTPIFASYKNGAKTKLTSSVDVYGFSHSGEVMLPNGNKIPAQLLSFASVYGKNKSFLTMSMPSIWREAEHLKSENNLDSLIRGVFVHEMAHTRQSTDFGERLTEIEKKYTFTENFDDDIIQNHFGKSADFQTAYEKENKLLYEAAAETNKERRRSLAKAALETIKLRRQKFFSGDDEKYAEIEEIFLTMEGLANWAAYKSITSDKLSKSEALKIIRRDGKNWSQDEGLAIFLIIDSLLPDWQKLAFAKTPASGFDLLELAIK